jgi:hypothetical protein
MTRYLSVLSLLLASCTSSPNLAPSPDQCYPVPFDHIWVRIPNSTYEEMKGSSYFGDNNLSFYEPNKSPLGTYYGHYITGEFHTLEIFEEKMSYTTEPLGIGFLSETQECLLEIHKRISDILPNSFELKPDADWGRFTQLKNSPEVALWVTELKPAYVGDPELLINRKAWARWESQNQ